MKRQWTREELAEHWTLDPGELALLANKAGPTRLGFAVLLKAFGYEAEVLCSAPEATMEFCVSFLLRLDEGQQRTIGRRRRDANGASTVDTGTADRLLRGGKIGCCKHETCTAALG